MREVCDTSRTRIFIQSISSLSSSFHLKNTLLDAWKCPPSLVVLVLLAAWLRGVSKSQKTFEAHSLLGSIVFFKVGEE